VALATGTRLGPYEVMALVGRGGMGEVYRARDTRLDRDVAIKVLASSSSADSGQVDRLIREARAISRLNHPHICALHDVGRHDGLTFLVMELLEGTTLAHEVAKGPLQIARAIDIAVQIADALDAAHRHGVIHLDLKPSNVMVTPNGVKLLDFGIAKLREGEESADDRAITRRVAGTKESAILGTYPYMSPERLQGREADARSDVFALGVVLYEMATGSRPFEADNRAALTAAILTQTPPPVSTVCGAPPLLDRVIDRCLEKDPEARWQNARDLSSALRWAREGDAGHAGPSRRATAGTSAWWQRRATATAVVLALLAGAGYLASALRTAPPASSEERTILAVLPFVNNTGDPEQDYVSDGMTDELIAQLGTLQRSRHDVIARTSSMHYKGTTKRADEIASELGARYLLEGSLRRTGDRVRIVAQFIDASNQRQVWTEQYDRDLRDVLRLQQEVAAAITRRTAGSLGVESAMLSASSPPRHSSNPDAYEHYLRGRYQFSKRTVDGLWKALQHFRTATGVDPSYGLAFSGLAATYAVLGSEDLMPMTESHPLGRSAALKALQVDDTLSEAHIWLANIIADHYWDWKEAERHFARALELTPSDADALRSYSNYLGFTGRAAEALPIAERAASLDPVSPIVQTNVGLMLYFAGRFDESAKQLEQALDLDPDFSLAHAVLGLSYLGKDMPDRAVAQAEKARALAGTRPLMIAFHGYALARAGRRRDALHALDALHGLATPRGPSPSFVAMVYLGLGERDRAFEWLDRAIDTRRWQLTLWKGDPMFDVLRSDPRFPALFARLGLPRH